MEKLKKILNKLLFPHIAVVIALVPIAAAMLIYAFAVPSANQIVAYASYFVSAYALTVLCVRAPELWRKLQAFQKENKYIVRYNSDAQLRIRISLYGSVAMNTLYALMQLITGFYHHSVWFYALAGYYSILALMRFLLLKDRRKQSSEKDLFMEYLHYRFCGIMLLLMNLTLSVIVFYIVWQNRGFEHHYIQTIAMAAYTFATMTMAIVNVIKYRKYESPVMSAATVLSLAAALVSMLSLETAMLTAFGAENGPQFRQTMTAATGSAVCLLVLIMAVYMIVKGTKEINRIKKETRPNE